MQSARSNLQSISIRIRESPIVRSSTQISDKAQEEHTCSSFHVRMFFREGPASVEKRCIFILFAAIFASLRSRILAPIVGLTPYRQEQQQHPSDDPRNEGRGSSAPARKVGDVVGYRSSCVGGWLSYRQEGDCS